MGGVAKEYLTIAKEYLTKLVCEKYFHRATY
jgi:hypothetical protein